MKPRVFSQWVVLVRTWRSCYELSQAEAAKRLRVPLKTLEKWEQGTHTPKGRNLDRIYNKFLP